MATKKQKIKRAEATNLEKSREDVVVDINRIEDNGRNTAAEVRTALFDLLDFSDERYTQISEDIDDLYDYLSTMDFVVTDLGEQCETVKGDLTELSRSVAENTNKIDLINEKLIDIAEPFHYWDEEPIDDNARISSLWYSFQGVYGKTVNFTFRIVIKGKETEYGMNYDYPLDNFIIEALEGIISYIKETRHKMSFVVSCTNVTGGIPKILTATFDFFEDEKNNNKGIRFNFYDQEGKEALIEGDEIFTSIQLHCPQFIFDK